MALDDEIKKNLQLKVEEADLALVLKKRSDNNGQWAEAHVKLAEALLELAGEENDKHIVLQHYHDVMDLYEKALNAFEQDQEFARWGGTIISYTRVLRTYALYENGKETQKKLHKCLELLGRLYDALSQDKDGFDRGLVAFERGHTYHAFADTDFEIEKIGHLHNASQAFADAADIMRLKENFNYWALAKTAQSLALSDLARLQKKADALKTFEEAFKGFDSILNYYEADKRPHDWSFIQFEMGRALLHSSIGDNIENKYLKLSKALKAFEAARTAVSVENGNNAIVRLQNETAMTLSLLSQHKNTQDPTKLLNQAIQLYQNNLAVLGTGGDPVVIAIVQGNMGKDLTMLANLSTSSSESLKLRHEAITALRAASIDALSMARPIDWLSYFIELGAALQAAANLETGELRLTYLSEAVDIYTSVIETHVHQNQRDLWMKIHQWRGLALAHKGEDDQSSDGLTFLKQAELDFRLIFAQLDPVKNREDYIRLQNNLGHLLFVMARRNNSQEPVMLLEAARKSMEDVIFLLKSDQNSDEWTAAMAHYGVVLWRLASFGEVYDCFEKSKNIFLKTLASSTLINNPLIAAKIKGNYALMLNDWSEHDKKGNARQHLQEARDQLSEALDIFREHGSDDDIAQMEVELQLVNDLLEMQKARKFWSFWPFNRGKR